MTGDMSIQSYLSAGGVLTSPANVPPRYRAELLKLMATFVDSELAGAAGFAEIINAGPGIKERIAAAKIVLEKTSNANRVLSLMGEFGADTDRYACHHPWTTRLPRDADIGLRRSEHDMRLAVFNYPLAGWDDAVVMNLLMGHAVGVQLAEYSQISYQPLAAAFRAIIPIEARHVELAEAGLEKLMTGTNQDAIQASVTYWWPRVAASFGALNSSSPAALKLMGLRKSSNADLTSRWQAKTKASLARHGLTPGQ